MTQEHRRLEETAEECAHAPKKPEEEGEVPLTELGVKHKGDRREQRPFDE